MADFRFGRVRLVRAERTQSGTVLGEEELRALQDELRRELDDPMQSRAMARFLDATVFYGGEYVLELVMEQLRAGRIIIEREPEPEVDPDAGLDPLTLMRLADQDEDEQADEEYAVEIVLIGEDDEPIAGVRYKITLPEGRVVTGRTADDGRAFLWGLTRAGDCKIEFPDLDQEAWEKVSSAPL